MKVTNSPMMNDWLKWTSVSTPVVIDVVKSLPIPTVNPPITKPLIQQTGERATPHPRSVLRYLDSREKDPPVVRFWA